MNTTVQLLSLYVDPEPHNAQRYRRTDGRTDRPRYDVKSRSYGVQDEYYIRSAKNRAIGFLKGLQ